MNEQKLYSKLEKEKPKEYDKKLSEPIGIKTVQENGTVLYETEAIKLSLSYGNFDEFKNAVEDMGGNPRGASAILKYRIQSASEFSFLKLLKIESKNSETVFDLEKEYPDIKVFVSKDNNGDSKFQDETILLGKEPSSIVGILILFHELGHKNVGNDIKRNTKKNVIKDERLAWAWALKKIKPFMKDLGVTTEDMDSVVHRKYLAEYSVMDI